MSEDFQKQVEVAKQELGITEETVSSEMETTPEVTQVEEQTIEQKAIEMGWKPDHKGPGFVSAKEFVERGSFFRKIDAQNKKIDDLIGVIKKLEEHNSKVQEASYKKGMEDALSRRDEAVSTGDMAAFRKAEQDFRKAEQDLLALEQQKPAPVPQANGNIPTQDVLDFLEENKTWLNNETPKNRQMVAEADGLFVLESQFNPTLSHKQVLDIVKQKIMKVYPEMFENPNKNKPIAVTKGSGSGSKTQTGLVGRMTDQQKNFFKQAQGAGLTMTIEEYAKQLDMTGDLKND